MRTFVLSSLAVLAIALPAIAESGPAFSRPPTEEYLRKLDTEQLRMVRRAMQQCPSTVAGRTIVRPERDPCVTQSTDRAVAESGDEDLMAFHEGLRPTDRYDENRTSAAWMVWRTKN